MGTRSVLGLASLLTLPLFLSAQTSTNDEDVKVSEHSCRIVQMTVGARERMRGSGDVPRNDEFTAAAKACKDLEKALSTSDQNGIKKATQTLHPIFALLGVPPSTPAEQLAALEKKTSNMSGSDFFYALADLAKKAFNAGQIDKAESYANRLLKEAPQYRDDWNYWNAIFFGNFVLGRVAVSRGDIKLADRYLLASGKTPGSPQLDSFGPNMTLAKELLAKGESESVLQYMELCKKFWEGEEQKLDEWRQAIRNGKTPDFGANLNY
jgi:tetratricopeptide (TPR) repeat protein